MDPPDASQRFAIGGVLRPAVARELAVELAVRLPVSRGLLERLSRPPPQCRKSPSAWMRIEFGAAHRASTPIQSSIPFSVSGSIEQNRRRIGQSGVVRRTYHVDK